MNERAEIPQGSEITVVNYNHNADDSLVEWNGRSFVVDKFALTAVAQPV